MTITLPDFLLARISEWEDAAHLAGPLHAVRDDRGRVWLEDGARVRFIDVVWWNHAAAHLPGRTLAECEALRAIVAHETRARRMKDGAPHRSIGGDFGDGLIVTFPVWTDMDTLTGEEAERYFDEWSTPIMDTPVLRALGGIWSDHPDYRQDWAL